MAKKIIALCLLVCILLCGCGKQEESVYNIENHDWKFFVAQSVLENGEIIGCAQDKKHLYEEDVKVLDIGLTVKDGKMTVTANGESYVLSYSVNSEGENNIMYNLTYEENSNNVQGFAVVGLTSKDDGSENYTLIISLNGYSIYFEA